MISLEIEAVVAIAQKLFGILAQTKAALSQIKTDTPEAYAEAEKLHRAAGQHIDDATQ